MKYEDTVMNDTEIRKALEANPNRVAGDVMQEAQAEISFKAGIREVVELDKDITEHILQDGEGKWSIESWRLKAFLKRRQAKLKKWGMK